MRWWLNLDKTNNSKHSMANKLGVRYRVGGAVLSGANGLLLFCNGGHRLLLGTAQLGLKYQAWH